MYPSPNAGGPLGDLPGEYKYKQNDAGELELWKGDVKVAVQCPDGSWLSGNGATAVSQLNLGGGLSSGAAYTINRSGQALVFKNEFSRTDPTKKLILYPLCQAVTADGTEGKPPVTRRYDPLDTAYLTNGNVGAATVACDFVFSSTGHREYYAITVLPAEDYTGKLTYSVISNNTGIEVFRQTKDANVVSGSELLTSLYVPFSATNIEVLKAKIIKEDGGLLRVRGGTIVANRAWAKFVSARYYDVGIQEFIAVAASKALVSDANAKVSASVTEAHELAVLSRTSPIDTTIDLDDDDGFITNSAGAMRQSALSLLWQYIKSKLGGSTTNLEAITQYGCVEASGGAWNGKTLTLGGMIFRWSQAASGGGYLTMEKDPATSLTQVSGGQTVQKYVAGTLTGNNTVNENMWPTTGTLNLSPSIAMTASSYQHLDYNLFTRAAGSDKTAYWTVKAFATGSGSLFLAGTYQGPKP